MVNKLRPDGEELFYQKYPRGDASKFTFGYNDDDQGKLKYIDIYYNKVGGGYLSDPRFKNNSNFTKYLYNCPYHRIIDGEVEGVLLIYQKEKKHKRAYPINGVDFYYDNVPVDIVLDYPVNNFRIYVNDRDYFMSKLPQLNIKSDNNAE